MPIDRKTVEHVAKLARLGLSDEDKDRMTQDLSGILEHVEVLSQLKTDDIEPLYHILPIQNVLREDTVHESGVRDDVLKHAPKARPPFFSVPQVFDE